jgi:hypothetical protein
MGWRSWCTLRSATASGIKVGLTDLFLQLPNTIDRSFPDIESSLRAFKPDAVLSNGCPVVDSLLEAPNSALPLPDPLHMTSQLKCFQDKAYGHLDWLAPAFHNFRSESNVNAEPTTFRLLTIHFANPRLFDPDTGFYAAGPRTSQITTPFFV